MLLKNSTYILSSIFKNKKIKFLFHVSFLLLRAYCTVTAINCSLIAYGKMFYRHGLFPPTLASTFIVRGWLFLCLFSSGAQFQENDQQVCWRQSTLCVLLSLMDPRRPGNIIGKRNIIA